MPFDPMGIWRRSAVSKHREGGSQVCFIINYWLLTYLLSRECMPYALLDFRSYYLSPWASCWLQLKIGLTFDIVLASVSSLVYDDACLLNFSSCYLSPWVSGWLQFKNLSTFVIAHFSPSVYDSWSPLLEYFFRSTIWLLKNTSTFIYYSSKNKSKMAALQASRGYMLKHEYANRIYAMLIHLPVPYSGLFLIYAYSAHYIIIHNILILTSYIINNNINNSWFSILKYCNIEFQLSNGTCRDINNHSNICTCLEDRLDIFPELYGGGKIKLEYKDLHPYIIDKQSTLQYNLPCKFIAHMSYNDAMEAIKNNTALIICRMPIGTIAPYLKIGQAKKISKVHGLFVARGAQLTTIVAKLISHQCSSHCYDNVYVFKPTVTLKESNQNWKAGISNAKHKE
jgi:hypothetical protein